MSNIETYKKELDATNKAINTINKELIKALQTVGIEFIDVGAYLTRYDALKMKKDKLLYLIALE